MSTHLIYQYIWVQSLDTAKLGPLILIHKVAVQVLTGLFASGGPRLPAGSFIVSRRHLLVAVRVRAQLFVTVAWRMPRSQRLPSGPVTRFLLEIATHFIQRARRVSLPIREYPGPL